MASLFCGLAAFRAAASASGTGARNDDPDPPVPGRRIEMVRVAQADEQVHEFIRGQRARPREHDARRRQELNRDTARARAAVPTHHDRISDRARSNNVAPTHSAIPATAWLMWNRPAIPRHTPAQTRTRRPRTGLPIASPRWRCCWGGRRCPGGSGTSPVPRRRPAVEKDDRDHVRPVRSRPGGARASRHATCSSTARSR